MKFCLINTIGFVIVIGSVCWGQEITAEHFTWKLIENSLNASKNTENFVIAPYQAYQLYEELFGTGDEGRELVNTSSSAIIVKQKTVNAKEANQTDLLCSISLAARWSFNFQTRDTHKRVFHQHGKVNEKMWVDFLRKDDTFYYIHDDNLNVSILELPLNVKDIKLTLVLPDQWNALPYLIEYFLENPQQFNDLIRKPQKMILVRVLLPKFPLTCKQDLTDFMQVVSGQQLEKYDHVYQVSNLEFNERGIGRFQKTTVLFWNAYSYLRVSPEIFDISHPFLFFISDKDGIQFFGQVVKMQH